MARLAAALETVAAFDLSSSLNLPSRDVRAPLRDAELWAYCFIAPYPRAVVPLGAALYEAASYPPARELRWGA